MKKFFIFFFSVILVFTMSVGAFADETYATYTDGDKVAFDAPDYVSSDIEVKTINDLFQYWEIYGCPDYVCGVWSTDGSEQNLTVGVLKTDEGENGKKEILEKIENDDAVTFVYQEYSKNYLLSIQDYLFNYYKTEKNGVEEAVPSSYLDEMKNIYVVNILEGKENDERVTTLLSELKTRFGKAVKEEYGAKPITFTEDGVITDSNLATGALSDNQVQNPKDTIPMISGGIVLIVFAIICFMVNKKKRVMQVQTPENIVIPVYSFNTKKEIEAMIKNADIIAPASIDEKLKEKM